MSHLVSCSVPNGPYLSRPSLIILCMSTSIPSRLSDTALLAEVLRLARSARATTVSLVAHLAELDARRLYLGAGFSSLFTYCTAVLGLSESETYNRISGLLRQEAVVRLSATKALPSSRKSGGPRRGFESRLREAHRRRRPKGLDANDSDVAPGPA